MEGGFNICGPNLEQQNTKKLTCCLPKPLMKLLGYAYFHK